MGKKYRTETKIDGTTTKTRVFLQIGLSEQEKKDIMDFANDFHKNASEFCRDAIFEKIRRIRNPELYDNIGSQVLSPELITQMITKQNRALELQEEMLERAKIFEEMETTLKLIQKHSTNQDFTIERKNIINLFKAHKSLNIKDIIGKTNYDKDIVFQILSDDSKFKLNINTGRFELNE